MDIPQFWKLIDAARAKAPDREDAEDVAACAAELLAGYPPEEILAAEQVLWDLMAASYLAPLWGAAYLANGGCSDDGFDYFRGWLIVQGRPVFEAVTADPDALADLLIVRKAVMDGGPEFDCEDLLSVPSEAYRTATGRELPEGALSINLPDLDPDWDFDFDADDAELRRRLPRTAALFAEDDV